MLVRTVLTVTLFTSLLPAADVFSVRSFLDPETKAKVPVTGALLVAEPVKQSLAQALQEKSRQCAIPLRQVKPGQTGDHLARPTTGPNPDPGSVVPAPVPVCKNWK